MPPRALEPKPHRARAIMERPSARLAVIAGVTTVVIVASLAVPLPASLAIAPVIAFLFSLVLPIMHEAAHDGFGSEAKSMAVGNVAGAVLLIAYPIYREIHLSHHADPGGPGDRELPVVIETKAGYLLHLTPWYFLIPFWIETVSHALDGGAAGRATRGLILPVAVSLVAATAIWPVAMTAAYWFPLLMTGFFLFVTTAHEHYSGREKEWRTRNLRCGPVLQWCLWNTNFHALHHAEPNVPSIRLRALDNPVDDVGLVEFHRAVWRDLAP